MSFDLITTFGYLFPRGVLFKKMVAKLTDLFGLLSMNAAINLFTTVAFKNVLNILSGTFFGKHFK